MKTLQIRAALEVHPKLWLFIPDHIKRPFDNGAKCIQRGWRNYVLRRIIRAEDERRWKQVVRTSFDIYLTNRGPKISDYIPKQSKPSRPKKRAPINKKYLKRRNRVIKNGFSKKLF